MAEIAAQNPHSRSKSVEELIAEHKRLHPYSVCPTSAEAKEQTRWFLDHATINISYDHIMMLTTLYVLFGSDFRLLWFPSSSDASFQVLNALSFFLFAIELILSSWAKTEFRDTNGTCTRGRGYMFSFFWWLDLIALLTVAVEVEFLTSAFGVESFFGGSDFTSSSSQSQAIAQKATRVVRMVRLVRLVKMYKIISQSRKQNKILQDLELLVEQGRMGAEEIDRYFSTNRMAHQEQSKVGAELVDMITRKVIICVLLMLIMVPLFTEDEQSNHLSYSAELFHKSVAGAHECTYYNTQIGRFDDLVETFVEAASDGNVLPESRNYINSITLEGKSQKAVNCTNLAIYPFFNSNFNDEVRNEELMVYEFCSDADGTVIDCSDGEVHYQTRTKFDNSIGVQDSAVKSIILTCVVTVVLIAMSIKFEDDAQKLVLNPIEEMMGMINMVADDPLEEFDFDHMKGEEGGAGEYETKAVKLAIQKITTLLRIGFGQAGADIISKNMSVEPGEVSSVLDPMIPGKRMYAIFGFCDIHEFDMCTEVLEDEIMSFVNNVARIVHEQVTRWNGQCNKNLGNAFLMVWRIGDEEDLIDSNARKRVISKYTDEGDDEEKAVAAIQASVNLRRVPGVDDLADKALFGFLKVVVEINRDRAVLAYRNDDRLKQNGHNFKLRMGFGLHAGWAIEGAVGSMQKVDATYLSPHVNMAARMEAASRQFGVAVLMTENFHELMSDEAQKQCRRLDVVTVKGSAVPMPIYTFDTFQNQQFPELQVPKNTDLSLDVVLRKQAENYTPREWSTDGDLQQLKSLATPEFVEKFKDGINTYLSGNWTKARTLLEECDTMMKDGDCGGDGPSRTILNYMRNRAWQCPSEWQGFRPLTSK